MSTASERPMVTIHTDGGCDPNPGPGGWAAVLTCGDQTNEISGREARTTNNRMELTAAIRGLEALKRPCSVNMYTDSQYLKNGITSWVVGWQRNGWRKRNGQPVENQDLWQALLEQVARHDVTWHWVRGHQGNVLNERADALATRAQSSRISRPAQTSALRPGGLPEFTLYCRGSCQGNPGPGGYAAVVVAAGGAPRLITGGWPNATSNAMELWAVIAGLRSLKQVARLTIHSASRYVLDGATRWLAEWEQHNWRTREGHEVQNAALWQELAKVMGDHDITWRHAPAALANEHLRTAARAAADAARNASQPHERKDTG